jgi:hypothetical protein
MWLLHQALEAALIHCIYQLPSGNGIPYHLLMIVFFLHLSIVKTYLLIPDSHTHPLKHTIDYLSCLTSFTIFSNSLILLVGNIL